MATGGLPTRRARQAPKQRFPRLRIAVVLIWALFCLFSIVSAIDQSAIRGLCAIVIGTVALFPAYIWADGRIAGLPILPLHVLTLLWTYALPLVAGHPELENYANEEIVFSTACVLMYAVSAAMVWIFVDSLKSAPRARFRVLPKNRGDAFFTSAIFFGAAFTALSTAQMIALEPGLYGILRATLLGLASVAIFVLSLRLGRSELRTEYKILFIVIAALYIVIQLSTLFLVGPMVTMASALIGFTIGRGRVPWVTIVAVVLAFGFLHSGKSEMRERYWSEDRPALQIWDLPQFFADWAMSSGGPGSEETANAPIYERVSLMHLLLLAQRSAPATTHFLEGETYAIIPRLLVPRILDPDKPDSHQGTTILNTQFGLQTAEEAQSTTLGWGLINEGYANFGLSGVAGVALFLGLMFGFAGKLTAGAPVMSLATMIGVTFCSLAIQTEFTMAVFVTVLFQSLVVLALVLPILESRPAEEPG